MQIRTEFPHAVRVLDDVRIPMSDGAELAATIWLPEGAEHEPVPAILEYLPYRKGDWTAPRDAQRHPWYAGHGYASVRVDIRGCGDSDGVMLDEYDEPELEDGLAVIAWLAAQPWCTGSVGMIGISWGGFNGLQLAARQPEALKAIVTVCSSDDRYADDVHYFGGAMLGIDMMSWAGTMFAFQSRPPAPWRVGERWEGMWRERLEALRPFTERWLAHQERDAYWRRGSAGEDAGKITAAVLAVGGWADPYRNTVFRVLSEVSAPTQGIIGPWSHQYPDIARTPGPTIGFLQETLRWWDTWLKGSDTTGMRDEPKLRAYHQDAVPPATHYPERPGRWIALDGWPSSDVATNEYPLDRGFLSLASGDGPVRVHSPQHTGTDAGRWFPFGNLSDLPPDQRAEDGRSVVFDVPTGQRTLELFGQATLRVRIAAERSRGTLTARLCDVAPDGSSTLITRGAINLTHRNGFALAEDLVPGEFVDAELGFVAVSYRVPPGHRLRLALSSSYWPWLWPHPEDGALLVDPAGSVLSLPELDPAVLDREPVSFPPAEQAAALPIEPGPPLEPRPERLVSYEPETQRWRVDVDPNYGGNRVYPDGLSYGEDAREHYLIEQNDPLSAEAGSAWTITLERGDWSVRIETELTLTGTATAFVSAATVRTFLNGEPFFSRDYRAELPRTSA